MIMKRLIIVSLLVLFISVLEMVAQIESNSIFLRAPTEQKDSQKAEESAGRWQKLHVPIDIYGRIIDQNNDVVGQAEVEISWYEPTIDLDLKVLNAVVKTDEQGYFNYKITKGTMPLIKTIHKNGYEFLSQWNDIVKLPAEQQGKMLAETSREEPVLLILRKMGETTFLLRNEGALIQAASQEQQIGMFNLLGRRDYADLYVETTYDLSDKKWEVTYWTTNETDGLIVSTNLLYEAPEEGYQKKVVWDGPPWPQYIYLQSRTPIIYSRLNMEYRSWKLKTNETFRIDYEVWINPYGSRNLEYEPELIKHWQLRKQLEQEAKDNLPQNKRPKKPDLKALIKEFEDKKAESI